jgi:hypothetical protein
MSTMIEAQADGQDMAAADAGKPRGAEGVRRMLRSLDRLRRAWLGKIQPSADRT